MKNEDVIQNLLIQRTFTSGSNSKVEAIDKAIKSIKTIEKIKEIIGEEEIYPVSNSLDNPRPNEQDYNKVHADKFNRIWKVISDSGI